MMGDWAGYSNTDGSDNVFIGIDAGYSNTTGWSNVFIGSYTGWANTIGEHNVFMGIYAGEENEDGDNNTFLGAGAGWTNISGSENVSIGLLAGSENNGNQNTFVGSYAGETNVNGENNVFIGYGAGRYETGSGKLYIDNDGLSIEPLVYGEFSNTDPYFNINAYTEVTDSMSVGGNMDVTGDITQTSDRKFKTNIVDYENALMDVTRLRGVNFYWIETDAKIFNTEERQIGLIAQEVEEVIPELVKTDREGNKTVNYSKLTVVLLEALKEQQKMIETLQYEVEKLKQDD